MRDILVDLEDGQDPQRQAQKHMQPRKPKRFYKEVTTGEDEAGFAILLDGRAVKTPGKGGLRLPTLAAAQLVADEFAAQTDEIDAVSMPVTRIANSAAEGVAQKMQEVRDDLAQFAGSDLICYRVDTPIGLVENQKVHWDPIINWVEKRFGARPQLAGGIIYVEQPTAMLEAISSHLNAEQNPFKLAALHVMTTMTGSALLALAHAEAFIDLDAAWAAAHVDEDWNIEKWGHDADAAARRDYRFEDMKAASRLFNAA